MSQGSGKGGRGGGGGGGRGGQGNNKLGNKQGDQKRQDNNRHTRNSGTVRAVSSGDTVTIIQLENGVHKEFQFSLLGLKAPQLGRRAKKNANQQQEKQQQQQQPEKQQQSEAEVKDEPWAWQSREFLREKLIGKVVIFRVEYTLDNGKRVGELWINDEDIRNTVLKNGWAAFPPRKDKEGNERLVTKEDQVLVNLQEEAKTKKIGIYRAPDAGKSIRKITYHDFSDQKKEATFFEKNKSTKRTAVVEHVRSGSTLRLYLVDSGDEIEVNLSGIRAPQMKTKESNIPEKWAADSKFYTEHKLLNRTVQVILDCVDKFNYYGTVLDEQGNNVVFGLLEYGLAQVLEWNIPSKDDLKRYQDAENIAKLAHLRLWTNYNAKQQNNQQNTNNSKNISGKVTEVNSLGTITIKVQENNNTYETKVHFSSIKVPKLPLREISKDAQKGKGKANNKATTETEEQKKENELKEKEQQEQQAAQEKQQQIELQKTIDAMSPEAKAAYYKKEEEAKKKLELEKEQAVYAVLGKEFLRKRLIGKTVRCAFDYSQSDKDNKNNKNNNNKNKQQQQQKQGVKHFFSIYEGKSNVALDIVRQGYANVINHAENQPRSVDYKDLMNAEREAQKEGKGLHCTKNKPLTPTVNDLSQVDEKKVQTFLQLLKGKQQGVIDMVWSAKKFKIYLPNHSVQIIYTLAGVDLPLHLNENPPPFPGKGDAYTQHPLLNNDNSRNVYNEAFHYARDNLLQRDCEIEVLDVAKVGNSFVGRLTVKTNTQTSDFAQDCLRKGYLRYNTFIGKKFFTEQQSTTMEAIEQSAKKDKNGFWARFDAKREQAILDSEKRANERAELQANSNIGTDRCIVVTEIINGSYFYYQVATEKSKGEIEDLMKEFGAINWAEKPAYTPVMPTITPTTTGQNTTPVQTLPRVAGNFSVDNTWYRAEVLEIIPPVASGDQTLYKLRYIDYGNTETVTVDRIRALPAEFQSTPAQAKKAKLAYITAPELDADYGPESAEFFKSLCWGKDLLANVQFTTTVKEKASKSETEIHHITLGDEETKIFINAAMVMHGLALVDSKKKLPQRGVKWPMWNILKEEEDIAKKDRLNIWQYGEYGSDDDEKTKFSGKKGKK